MTDPVGSFLRHGFARMARRDLRGVWLRGQVPRGPFIWAANHHSWWDPFLASLVLGPRACLIMDQANLDHFPFATRLGVFGTATPRRGLDLLRTGRTLVIYPEAELLPAGPPGPLSGGAAWYAHRAPAPLHAAAVRVIARGHQAPDVFIDLAPVALGDTVTATTQNLTTTLKDLLTAMDRLLAETDPRRPLPGYTMILRGRRSMDERIDTMARWRPWPSSAR